MTTTVNHTSSVVKTENGKVTVNGKEYPVSGNKTEVKVNQVNGKGTLTINGTEYPLETAAPGDTSSGGDTTGTPAAPQLPAVQDLIKNIQTNAQNVVQKATSTRSLNFSDFQGIKSSLSSFISKLREQLKTNGSLTSGS